MPDTKAAGIIAGLLIVRDLNYTQLAARVGVSKQLLYQWHKRGLKDEQVTRILFALDADDDTYRRCGVAR